MKSKIWTDANIVYLTEHYASDSDSSIARHLSIDRKTVSQKSRELGLEKGIDSSWLERAEKVRDLYSSHSHTEIANKVGISLRSVARIVSRLGLRRTRNEERSIRSRIRQEMMKREKRRILFGLPPITNIKVVTNKPRIKLRHSLKKAGYIALRGENVMYYHSDMERDNSQEEKGRTLGLRFEPWENCNQKLCVNI